MKRLFILAVVILTVVPCCIKSLATAKSSLAFTPLSTPSPEIATDPLSFNGEVIRGQTFEREMGNNLVFRLDYDKGDGEGWYIEVADKMQPDHNFCLVVTFPFRGINSLDIQGWHFRNSDNSGPNKPGDKQVHAPQEKRSFRFVLDETGYQTASDAVDKLMHQYLYSEEEVAQAREIMDTELLEKATGVLTITHIELGNLMVGERAWINYMEFEVELDLPCDFYDSCPD
jgi:hypothetical protein